MTQTVTSNSTLRATADELWNFVRRPYLPSADLRGLTRANLAGVGRLFVVNLLLNLGLVVLLGMVEWAIGDVPEPTVLLDAFEQNSWPVVLLLAVLVAPIIEELLFRSWLSGVVRHPPRWFRTAFPAIYWLQALGFSAFHLSNYGETDSPLVLLFVIPQLISGLSFGYARVRFGWWAAALIHIAHNGSLVPLFAVGIALESGG